MANTILITANWHTGALSQQTISRQYDNNRYVVQFVGYPEASEGNELDYYLLVWMSSAPGETPDEIAPIQLASDQWYISNVFTQQTQQIKFQMCALNTEGTFEAHSPIFTGFVRNSLDHDGTTQDIDVSTLFDAYREYLNELIIRAGAVVIDSTLSQSGQAADAKVVGDKIGGIDNQLRDNHLAKRIVENSYVKNNGQFSNYSGWNRTDYIRVDYIDTLKVTATAASNYNVFYDENKVKIPTYNSASATAVISIVSGENEVKVPPNAKYVMFSGAAEMINTLIVEPLKTRSEYANEAGVAFVQENVYGKQNLVFTYNDISIGTLNAETGAEEAHAYSMRSGYIPIINTQNVHNIKCNGFKYYVYEYSYNGTTYEFLGRTATVVHNAGKWTGSKKTTHIRIWAQTTNSNNITSGIIDTFVKAFKMSEIRDINKYLRVCTFNQAANTDPYMSASEESTKKRALNHLNFLGEYNPDIICAQEALGNYFQPVAYEISVGNVYDRKYFYMHNPGYQRRTWSKYNMSQLAKVDFVSQASGDNRFYGKCLIAFEGIDIWLINTHCAFQGNDDFELARKGQFEELIAEMQQHEYCILCGDFNAWSADEFSLFTDAGFNIANCGDFGELITWDPHHASQTWPFGAFDNIITTPNIYIQNVKLGPYDFNLFSDHIPLIADLQIR